jgi:uncharacterized protein YycO
MGAGVSQLACKTITFQLVRGLAWTSSVIGYFGAGYYSHIDTLTNHGMLRGARADEILGRAAGVEDRPMRYEKWKKCTQYSISVTNGQYDRFWNFSDKQVGKPYDKHGLVSSFVFGRQWREDDSWWCSELVASCLEHAGIVRIPPEVRSVTPGDCAFLFAGMMAHRREIIVT